MQVRTASSVGMQVVIVDAACRAVHDHQRSTATTMTLANVALTPTLTGLERAAARRVR